ncbi:signal recognition particle receptor subunit beta-like [Lytechinus variegatus]|uniref:signal recognition particle receptor subunit beta-like n=1 Tax=Lytechinus variegatus TaxID=7654 RepID=UPI001BB0E9A3|nr:signal recognition particle receptor subunit beta-like [Lytechinus variegatus]
MSAASGVDVLQGYFENVKSEVSKQDPIILGVAVAIIVILFTIVLLRLFRGSRNNRRSVLVLGLCESGKTLLYSRLVHKKAIESYTSIKENSGPYQVIGQSSMLLEVIDIPGNDRQRIQFWNRFKTQARGVIFLVDSSSITKDLKEVAEFLYTLLSDSTTTNLNTPFLIACNKQDITMAKSARIIQTLLEKEMTTLRVTRAATLSSTDGSAGDTNKFLGKQGKDFDFSYLSNPVDFVECSARGSSASDEGELNTVSEWISNLV